MASPYKTFGRRVTLPASLLRSFHKEIQRLLPALFISALYIIVSGCTTQGNPANFKPFEPFDLNDRIDSGSYTSKVDTFIVIMDASSTMNGRYLYEAFESDTVPTLFEVEKELLRRLNNALPAIDLNAGIRTFGFGPCLSWRFSLLALAPAKYDKKTFNEALDRVECAGGGSPIDFALYEAGTDLESLSGNAAVIIVSDGDMDDDAAIAVFDLKKKFVDRVCVHTITISQDPGKRLAMRKLSALSGCGYTTTAEEMASKEGMAEFIQKVFLRKI